MVNVSTATTQHGATIARQTTVTISEATEKVSSGKDVKSYEEATVSILTLDNTKNAQFRANAIRGDNVLRQAINDMKALEAQLMLAYEVAEQVASDTKVQNEIVILAAAFAQYMAAANGVAQNSAFLEEKLLNSANGTTVAATNANATNSGVTQPTIATSIDQTTLTLAGNIFGKVSDVNVHAGGTAGTYHVSVTLEEGGKTYTVDNKAVTVANNGVVNLVSSLDGQSYINFDFDADSTGITNASQFETSLKEMFQINALGLNPTSFTPNMGTFGADIAIDVSTSTKGPGEYRFTQDAQNQDRLTVIAPDLDTVTVDIDTAIADSTNQFVYAFGAKITLQSGVGGWNGNMDMGANASSAYYASIKMEEGTAGYSKTIDLGAQDMTITIADWSNSGQGLDTLVASTVADATTAKTALDAALKNLSLKIGELAAQQSRVQATRENMEKTIATVEEVKSVVEDADLLEATIDSAEAMLVQVEALNVMAAGIQQSKKLMGIIGQAL